VRSKKLLVRVGVVCVMLVMVSLIIAQAGVAKAKSVDIKVLMPTGPKAGYWEHCFKPLFDKIKELTEGRITYTVYFQNQLCSPVEYSDAVRAGIGDFAWAIHGYTPGKFPLSTVMELPFLIPTPTVGIGGPIFRDLYEEFPEIRAEYKDWKLLWLELHMAADIHSRKPITSLDQLKGMKVLTQPSESKIELMKLLGATPINMDVSDFYTALSRGMADAAFMAWGAYEATRMYELTSCHYLIAALPVACYYIMNKDTFNSLSPFDQKIVEAVLGLGGWGAMRDTLAWSRWRVINGPCKDDQYFEPSPEDIAKARKLAKPVWDKWVAQGEAKGLPARQVLNRTIELVEKYKLVYEFGKKNLYCSLR